MQQHIRLCLSNTQSESLCSKLQRTHMQQQIPLYLSSVQSESCSNLQRTKTPLYPINTAQSESNSKLRQRMDVQQTHFSVSRQQQQQQQQNSASCSECEGTDKQTGHVFQERRLIPRRTFYTNRFHLYIGVVHETRWTSGLAAADNYTINRQTQPRRWRKPAHAAIP